MLGKAEFTVGTNPPQLNCREYRVLNLLQRRGERFPMPDFCWALGQFFFISNIHKQGEIKGRFLISQEKVCRRE